MPCAASKGGGEAGAPEEAEAGQVGGLEDDAGRADEGKRELV